MEDLRANFDLVVANTQLFSKRGDDSELGKLMGKVVEAVVGGKDPATVVMERGKSSRSTGDSGAFATAATNKDNMFFTFAEEDKGAGKHGTMQ